MNLHSLRQLEFPLGLLAALSIATFLISILCIPLLVARLPRNYFQDPPPEGISRSRRTTFFHPVLLILRNVVGLLLLLAGIAMLFLPGQGVITIIIGLACMSFPRKRRILRGLTKPEAVRNGLNWIRRKMNKEPFYW